MAKDLKINQTEFRINRPDAVDVDGKEQARLVKTSYIISEDRHRALKMLAASCGKSISDLLREGIDMVLKQYGH